MGFLQQDYGTSGGRIFTLQCDCCAKVFVKKHKVKYKNAMKHFCSGRCALITRHKEMKENNIDYTASAREKLALLRENKEYSQIAVSKFKTAIKEKYGVDNISQLEQIKQKKIATSIKKYGVDHPMKLSEVKQKLLESMKQKNSYKRISNVEYIVLKQLQEIYGVESVKHQHPINGWAVDFYISAIDIYLQIDGVYWHGLIENMQLDNYRGKSIQKTMEKDKKQNIWFNEQGLKLVRYTDLQIKNSEKIGMLKNLLIFNKEKMV